MASYEIPLAIGAQNLTVSINSVSYYLEIYWRGNQYVLDILDNTKIPLVQGIGLVTGINLLSGYRYLFNFSMEVRTDVDIFRFPSYADLGINSHLVVTY
jgi:hypothetical protein